ncbi:hypothetical protein J7I98_13665 [Streptomyces sp. ISL-98]|uniref:hypothetical protein n=1 Tax=Streptomyces sp. ISL-98 TaxID=2819192 RepID=UPI001BE90CA8|nr:hypothetical protein [Streptomyces sp. ISL-98]MBT2506921.1 hypothetical protein [Streptomyces sp. ISL-98]
MNHNAQLPLAQPLWEHDLPPTPTSAPYLDRILETARDAADRAQALLGGKPLDADPLIDLVRLLHGRPTTEAETAATRAGLRPAQLRRLRTAFTIGGATAVNVALYLNTPQPSLIDHTVQAIQRVRPATAAPLKILRNRITDAEAGVQIRLGPDSLCYPFTVLQDDWVLARRATPSPTEAYTAARQALRSRRG